MSDEERLEALRKRHSLLEQRIAELDVQPAAADLLARLKMKKQLMLKAETERLREQNSPATAGAFMTRGGTSPFDPSEEDDLELDTAFEALDGAALELLEISKRVCESVRQRGDAIDALFVQLRDLRNKHGNG